MSKTVNHLKNIRVQDYYGTPKEVFERGVEIAGFTPKVELCADKNNHVMDNYIDENSNCLQMKSILFDFFMNPPYSRVAEFMELAYRLHKESNVNALILIYAKTDTKWWHEYVEGKAEVHFIKGRIKFNDKDGKPTKMSAPYGSCYIIYKKDNT